MRYFITPEELNQALNNKDNVLVVDCRGNLADYEKGQREYLKSHIQGSLFLDGETILSGKKETHGGRHPFPDLHLFKKQIEELGIDNNMMIVAHGLYAGRLLFMLKILNFSSLKLLVGGFELWLKKGYKVVQDIPKYRPSKLSDNFNLNLIVQMEEVKDIVDKQNKLLVDSRAKERYLGLNEPIDLIAGHIPSAINCCWKESFYQDYFLNVKSVEELQKIWQDILSMNKDLVLYCGSGVTATFNYFILQELGVDSQIYSGSYSDWISYVDNKINSCLK